MLYELSVQAIASARAGSDTAADPKATTALVPLPRVEPVSAPSPIINPTLRLNAALGLVVIEFRNDTGAITTSIPSQRQLAAYQRWETTQFGPSPARRAHAASPPSEPAVAVEPREAAPARLTSDSTSRGKVPASI